MNGRITSRAWTRVALVGALAAAAALGGCKAKADANAAENGPPPVVIGPENLAVAERTELATGPMLSGQLTPEMSAQVRAEVGGAVLEVRADAGQQVKEGELLARIDDTALRDAYLSARTQVRAAESSAQLARRNAERSQRLAEAGAVAERDLEQTRLAVENAEGTLADARARLTNAEKQLAKTQLRAPFAGIVGESPLSPGDVVQPGTLLFTVVRPSSMRLEAAVPAVQLAHLKVGTPVQFTVTGYGDRRFAGKITRVSPVADPATGQVRITAAIPNAGNSLVAGLFAEGRVNSETRTGVVVPSGAVNTRGLRPTVMRLKGGRVERIEVETGLSEPAQDRLEIRRGLLAGDTVLLASAQGTPVGAAVRVQAAPRDTAVARDTAPTVTEQE